MGGAAMMLLGMFDDAQSGGEAAALAALADDVPVYFRDGTDVGVLSYLPTSNLAASTTISVGARKVIGGGTESLWHMLLRFDISAIPADSVVSAASLTLTKISGVINESELFTLARLTQVDWTEAAATWNRRFAGNNWTTPGGTYTLALSDTKAVAASGDVTFDSVVDLCDHALDNTAGICDWIVFSDALVADTQWIEFASGDWPTLFLRPALCVTFAAPPASTATTEAGSISVRPMASGRLEVRPMAGGVFAVLPMAAGKMELNPEP